MQKNMTNDKNNNVTYCYHKRSEDVTGFDLVLHIPTLRYVYVTILRQCESVRMWETDGGNSRRVGRCLRRPAGVRQGKTATTALVVLTTPACHSLRRRRRRIFTRSSLQQHAILLQHAAASSS